MLWTRGSAPAPIEELLKSSFVRPPPVALRSAPDTPGSIGTKPDPIRPPSEWPTWKISLSLSVVWSALSIEWPCSRRTRERRSAYVCRKLSRTPRKLWNA